MEVVHARCCGIDVHQASLRGPCYARWRHQGLRLRLHLIRTVDLPPRPGADRDISAPARQARRLARQAERGFAAASATLGQPRDRSAPPELHLVSQSSARAMHPEYPLGHPAYPLTGFP